jgi:glycerophosphoryl diester phosphodiesterase
MRLWPDPLKQGFLMISIVAQRGYSSRFRENSPLAWSEAAKGGADVVEADVRFTADGVAVCVHDADLKRMLGRDEAIAALDYATLSGLTAAGEPVAPRFADALTAVPPTTSLLLDRLDQLVRDAGARDVILGLHRREAVETMARLGHTRILGLMLDRDEGERFIDAGATIIRVWEADVTPERLAPLLSRDVPIWSTTGDQGTNRLVGDFDIHALRQLAEAGVTGFLVNDPVGAREALAGANT